MPRVSPPLVALLGSAGVVSLPMLFGAGPPEDAPKPAPASPAPPASPPLEPPPPSAPERAPASVTDDGSAELQAAISALGDGRHQDALEIAIPALSKYPQLAPSFQAVIDLASDQLARGSMAMPAYPTPTAHGGYAPYGYAPIGVPPDQRRGGLHVGVDLGLPTGLRLEFRTAGPSAVDSLGIRVGGNLLLYSGLYTVGDMTLFADVKLAREWQLEVVGGMMIYYGDPYPQAGVAAQYDPEGPLHVNLGARVGNYFTILPDVSVGFVW